MTFETSDWAEKLPPLGKPEEEGDSGSGSQSYRCSTDWWTSTSGLQPLQPGDTSSFFSSTGDSPVLSPCHRSHQSSTTTTAATTTPTTSNRKRNCNLNLQNSSVSLVPRPSPPCSDTKIALLHSTNSLQSSVQQPQQQYHNLSQHFWSEYSTFTLKDTSSTTTSHKCSQNSSEVRWQGLSLTAIVTLLFLISSSVLLQCHHVEAHWQENISPRRRIHLSK